MKAFLPLLALATLSACGGSNEEPAPVATTAAAVEPAGPSGVPGKADVEAALASGCKAAPAVDTALCKAMGMTGDFECEYTVANDEDGETHTLTLTEQDASWALSGTPDHCEAPTG